MKGDILIVDDQADVRAVLREILEVEGLTIREAPDGETALRMCAERVPRVVFLDLSMPGMDGLEVLRALKADEHTAPAKVVIVTARGEIARAQGVAAGADEFYTKPFSPLAILQLVENMLSEG